MQSVISHISSLSEYESLIKHYMEIQENTNTSLNYFILQNATQNNSAFSVIEKLKYTFQLRLDVKVTPLYNSEEREVLKIILTKVMNTEDKVMNTGEQLSGTIIFDNNKKNKITLVVSDAPSKFLFHAVNDFINHLYPFYKRKFITSSQIEELLLSFLQQGYHLTASMVSTKRWWEKPDKRYLSSTVQFPRALPIEDVLEELKKTNSFINSITLNILDESEKRRILKCYISRSGRIQFKWGNYQLFETSLLMKLAQPNLFRFRSKDDMFGEIVPIKVNFAPGLELYNEKLVLANFYNAISKDGNYKLSVYHAGNPYYHIGITDSKDGSVFDLLFYDFGIGSSKKYEMLIIPKLNVSLIAIDRLLEQVFYRFGEGKIEKWLG